MQNSFTNCCKSLQYNKPSSFLVCSPYNPLVLPANLQLSLSNALQIPLGSKFLTDLSTFKRLHFGMLYHIIFALILILLNLILCSHYRLLNSTSCWKLTFFFIPSLLSLSSLLDWPLGTLIWPVCHSLFIPNPSSSIRSSDQLALILCLSYSVSEKADRNSMNSCQLHDALKIFLIAAVHHIFHFTFSHFTSSFVCHMHVVV